jgi:hypothetical protein
LRGLIYVLSDLSQVDPSDLSTLFAGHGRLRIGFSEIDPSASHEPDDRHVEDAVRRCWQNSYYAFSKPVGTSLVCIQGDWSNVVDAKIKGGLAAFASGSAPDNPYTPLYARATHAPKPWGVTALFAEYTGNHPPLAIDWTLERKASPLVGVHAGGNDAVQTDDSELEIGSPTVADVVVPAIAAAAPPQTVDLRRVGPSRLDQGTSFASLWDFAVAVNRGDPAALALASGGGKSDIPIDGGEVKKLLGTMWFRTVVPRLSQEWRERVLEVLVASASIPNHLLRVDRRAVRLSELSYPQLKELFAKTYVEDAARADLELLITVGRLWGAEALARFQFAGSPENGERSRLTTVLQGFRK